MYIICKQSGEKKGKLTIYLNKFSESIGLEKWRCLHHKTKTFISQLISSVVYFFNIHIFNFLTYIFACAV